jgi:hypothetical protein
LVVRKSDIKSVSANTLLGASALAGHPCSSMSIVRHLKKHQVEFFLNPWSPEELMDYREHICSEMPVEAVKAIHSIIGGTPGYVYQ